MRLLFFGSNLITLVFMQSGRSDFLTTAFLPRVPDVDTKISFSLHKKCEYFPKASSLETKLAASKLISSPSMHRMLINFTPNVVYCQFLIPGPSWNQKTSFNGTFFFVLAD
jgi:hypothetical protein